MPKSSSTNAEASRLGRPPGPRPEGPGLAFADFLNRHIDGKKFTNGEVAEKLGYSRPNIVSTWKVGAAKVTLDNVFPMADMFHVDPAYMMALYIDQYSAKNNGIDRFHDIVAMLTRICTEEEWEIIREVRAARINNSFPITEAQRRGLRQLFEVAVDTPEGPYEPVEPLPDVVLGERKLFSKRGFHRTELNVSPEEDAADRKATAPAKPKTVRKRSAAAKEPAA